MKRKLERAETLLDRYAEENYPGAGEDPLTVASDIVSDLFLYMLSMSEDPELLVDRARRNSEAEWGRCDYCEGTLTAGRCTNDACAEPEGASYWDVVFRCGYCEGTLTAGRCTNDACDTD